MKWTLTSEKHLAETYANHINPFWKGAVNTGEFKGKHDVMVHYAWCQPENAHTHVVISSGRIESLLKYKELMYDFFRNGFAVYILDHRGQGLSGRMTSDPQHGYVADFDDYVDDLLFFCDSIVASQTDEPLHLLCHSMGGAIGTLALLKAPKRFASAVLCSPMFGVRPALPNWLAKSLICLSLKLQKLMKRDSGYFFGQTPYLAYPYAINTLTHSENRYRLFRKLYDDMREIQLGGVTTHWLRAAVEAMDTIEMRSNEIEKPVLLFSASGDKIIDNTRQLAVAEKFKNADIRKVPEAYHELFAESDEYRGPVLQQIMSFLHDRRESTDERYSTH
ncbi:alpha/beta fold hydrolase [Alteromonas sp. ASW11-130]|uniref:alpha/beta fold hydrolase n=1 Tax=Alteromonas sp. ASW11-130 TaxID=3015775 RepID=UPI0022423276|nr:alpha/beta fold hydrolase [Alteromonas sp. ASW11-130]MCW8090901.1 alpha/beta fold hydrolase [Alteromonas sp. ASW11-130]